jgi:hypothetical protein
MESLTGWLESIRYYGLYEEHALQGESANPEGQVVGHSRMGTVIDLCQASVDLCKHLESLALEEERKDGLRRSEELKAEESQSYKATFDENSLKPDIPSSLSALVEENASGDSDDPIAAERSSAILKFKSRAKAQGIRVTDEMVAKAAKPGKWNTRTMVTWWKRNDKRCERPHDRLIRSVLARDPRSVWPPDHGEN